MTSTPRRLRIDLAYDGTEFEGFQLQASGRTVQGVVEDVLSRINGNRPARLRAASRTDSGVHARMQVADVLLSTDLADGRIEQALHRMLPDDVRPLRAYTVDPAFHSRRDARGKTYRYQLDLTRYGDPRRARYAWRSPFSFDRHRLGRVLERMVGRHDWSGFVGGQCNVRDHVRNLTEARFVTPDTRRAYFSFSADGFLNYMVRNLVGTALEIARGRASPERLDELLEHGHRELCGPTAPASGLVLWHVLYEGDNPPSNDAESLGEPRGAGVG